MSLRFAMATIACVGLSLTLARADGMPDREDKNFNPVPSVPGVPAPGVPATPPNPPKPAAMPAPTPATAAAPASAVTPAPSAPATPPVPVALKKAVYEIVSIDVQIAERQPPFITVTVKGVARTGGWKDVELQPLPTFAKEVGMRSFKLVGTPPDGPATQALTPVTATIKIDPLPDDVKTIRVLGETNEVSQTFR